MSSSESLTLLVLLVAIAAAYRNYTHTPSYQRGPLLRAQQQIVDDGMWCDDEDDDEPVIMPKIIPRLTRAQKNALILKSGQPLYEGRKRSNRARIWAKRNGRGRRETGPVWRRPLAHRRYSPPLTRLIAEPYGPCPRTFDAITKGIPPSVFFSLPAQNFLNTQTKP
ncbi:hypothetical protein AB6A40_008991 [Gnathostoma spinigerum]|uniref:Uncharacterized protein n=1 Tax=Gnathostoma spinigerum TaxID=75299 RepID=A0ABD6EZY0_9BILA